jgi:hypothetical protein
VGCLSFLRPSFLVINRAIFSGHQLFSTRGRFDQLWAYYRSWNKVRFVDCLCWAQGSFLIHRGWFLLNRLTLFVELVYLHMGNAGNLEGYYNSAL